MSKRLIPAIAIAAMLLSPSLASARAGSAGVSTHVGGHVGSGAVVRVDTKPTPLPPRVQTNVKMLKCHQHPRGNGQGGTVYVTVCN